jgi:RimJ/RimL family protein N-acetyltransferase
MASLANPNGQLLIAEHDGVAIGTVRLDFSGDRCELSWTVAPEARGRGLGSLMVAGAVPAAGGKNVVAEIKRGNSASIRIAAKAGFRFFEERDGLQVWRR